MAPPLPPTDITEMLNRGDLDAVTPLVYEELRQIAWHRLQAPAASPTLNTSGLIAEAYAKLVDATQIEWQSRAHFFAVSSTAMRQVLLNYARDKRAGKRGGGQPALSLREAFPVPLPVQQNADDLIALDEALTRLAEVAPRAAQVVEHRFFGGYTVAETAAVMDLSERTVKREWRTARAWLQKELKG